MPALHNASPAVSTSATLCLAAALQTEADTIIVGGSTILSQSQANQLGSWVGRGIVTLTNIFSKTAGDGKTATDFHAAADRRGRTYTLLEVTAHSNGMTYVIGGYNPVGWDSSRTYHINSSDENRVAFIFNLTGEAIRQAQKPTGGSYGDYGRYQTFNHPHLGPTFGEGYDLYSHYLLERGLANNWSYGPGFGNNIFNIGRAHTHYTISKLEVFTIQH